MNIRHAIHPGLTTWDRVLTAVGAPSRSILVRLEAGASLGDAIRAAFHGLNLSTGSFRLFGALLARAAYHLASPRDGSARVIEYGAAKVLASGALIVEASGSFGLSMDGETLVHVHGALADARGRAYGGHLNVDRCIIGPETATMLITAGAGFRQAVDAETGFATFVPWVDTAND